ncbi:hypothetical protein J2Z29_002041 [Treponema pedis]|uniref:Uncharacterized protein n=1 Tax=Treponema pedis str. T A4 TaxID=1291379 RepID=S6A8G7_9SPIR|nr:hypothetical protein TPE_1304 [Treponema pedis str. T A4]
MMKLYWQFKIESIAEKAIADNNRFNGTIIKREKNSVY